MSNKNNHYNKIPCKVGDMVLLETECINISTNTPTSAKECPFEKDCHFEDCDIYNKRKFISPIRTIYNKGNGWKFKLKHLECEVDVRELGKTAYIIRGKVYEKY